MTYDDSNGLSQNATIFTGPTLGNWMASLRGNDRIPYTALRDTPGNSTETVNGLIEIATRAETLAGTDTSRAITPARLADVVPVMNAGNRSPVAANQFTVLTRGSSSGWRARGGDLGRRSPSLLLVWMPVASMHGSQLGRVPTRRAGQIPQGRLSGAVLVTLLEAQRAGQRLSYNSLDDLPTIPAGLPAVTTANNGQIVKVINGVWALGTDDTATGGTGIDAASRRLR